MQTTLPNAKAILGPELIKVFQESCQGDKTELEAMIQEALRALRFIRLNDEFIDNQNYYDNE